MKDHQIRLLVIAALVIVALIGMIVLSAVNVTSGTGFGAVAGVLTVGVPALLDAARVEARRRTPGKRAIANDVP